MKTSLFKKLFIVELTIVIVVSLALFFIGVNLFKNLQDSYLLKNNNRYADMIAEKIDRKIERAKEQIATWSETGLPASNEEIKKIFQTGSLDAVFLIDQKGQLAAAYDQENHVINELPLPEIIGEIYVGNLVSNGSHVIISDKLKTKEGGYLVGVIDLNYNESFNSLIKQLMAADKQGDAFLLNAQGEQIYRTDNKIAVLEKPYNTLQSGYIIGQAKSAFFDWSVLYVSRDTLNLGFLLAPETINFILLGVMVFILLLIINIMVMRKVTRPIEQLVEKVHSVEYGNYEPVQIKTKGEIGELAEAFNEMMERLKVSYEKDKWNEEKLRQAEKINVIGELAAATSHEIRNPLTSIKGFAQLLQKNSDNNHKIEGYTKYIQREVSNIEKTIKQFLLLARPTFPQLRKNDIHTILDEVLPAMAMKAVNRRILISTDYCDDISEIMVDRDQIIQLFFNIGTHAIDNTEIGGELHVKTSLNTDKSAILIDFAYRGTDIATAEDSLTLATSYQIVNNHKGTLLTRGSQKGNSLCSIKLPIIT